MKASAWGYGRYCGTHTLCERDLTRYRAFDVMRSNDTSQPEGVSFTQTSFLQMSGNYSVQIQLSKSEIARMFYETHAEELTAFARSVTKFVPLQQTFAPLVRDAEEAAKQKRKEGVRMLLRRVSQRKENEEVPTI